MNKSFLHPASRGVECLVDHDEDEDCKLNSHIKQPANEY